MRRVNELSAFTLRLKRLAVRDRHSAPLSQAPIVAKKKANIIAAPSPLPIPLPDRAPLRSASPDFAGGQGGIALQPVHKGETTMSNFERKDVYTRASVRRLLALKNP